MSASPTDNIILAEETRQDLSLGSPETKTVTVIAKRASEQIDRSAYDVKLEAITPNASVADVIANVPNVTVDMDGKVAIRGNQNAQVFVDGKPSAMFSGASAGNALNTYPASALKSIEVITTPGAEFSSESGSGPILNLITRRVRPLAAQGLASISVGPHGRGGTSLSGSYVTGRFQLEGSGNVIRNLSERHGSSDTDVNLGNAVWKTHRDSTSRTPSTTLTLSPTIRYNRGETDRIIATLNFSKTRGNGSSDEYYRTFHDGLLPYEEYERYADQYNAFIIYQAVLGWERKFSATEELRVDLRNSGSETSNNRRNRDAYVIAPPSAPSPKSNYGNNITNRLTELSSDYTKRINSALNFKIGAKLGWSNGQTDADYFSIDPLTGEEMIDKGRNSAFRFTERSYAVYFSPNVRLSERWAVLPGIRYERMTRLINYNRQDLSIGDNICKVLPSLHVQYGWGERGASVRGAYSRRITRPSPGDINPDLQYLDEQTYSQGDPRLVPMHSDKFELKYSDAWPWLNSNMSLFRERDSPLLGRVLAAVPDSVAVISKAVNFGAKSNDGISWNLQIKPSRELRLDATVSFRHMSQSILAAQFNDNGGTVQTQRKATSKNLQLGGQYSAIKGHTFQLDGNYTGRQLNGLFETGANWQAHASWMWRFSPYLTLRTSIRDIFNSNRIRNTLIVGKVRQYNNTEQQGRTLTLALSYMFGGVPGDVQTRNNSGMVRKLSDQNSVGSPSENWR